MKLFVGLGNPCKTYQNTRHNLGSNILLALSKQLAENKFKKHPKLLSKTTKTGVGESKIIFAIPTTYMNNSGLAVQKLINFYKITPKDLYIIHDDLDLKVGEYKIQFNRGPAGHNGIKSIIKSLNTKAFWRIRVGIDHPKNNIPTEDYVLKPFSSSEKTIISQTINKIVNVILIRQLADQNP
ncbi:aminoacyl-tRNA hydrolase [Patescibacteria group bacterium]|nr:aminoacyl-tRNA hydrolase [Patescibacteria group bacterium]